MDVDSLVRMANQIGTFFEAMPDREEALEDIALHLRRFWAPPMRRALLTYFDEGDSADLNPMVAEAIGLHRGVATCPKPTETNRNRPAPGARLRSGL